jgi:hypothetical protein
VADLLVTDNTDLNVFNVDFKGCLEISHDVKVCEPALIILKDGQEIIRYPGGHIN